MTGETVAELRARLGALLAAVDEVTHPDPSLEFNERYRRSAIFGQDLRQAWPAIDGMLARLVASDENADRLAGMVLRLAAEKGDLVARLAAANPGCRTCASDVGVLTSGPVGLCADHADALLASLAAAETPRAVFPMGVVDRSQIIGRTERRT